MMTNLFPKKAQAGILLVVFLTTIPLTHATVRSSTPIMIGGNPDVDACSLGVVTGLNQSPLYVRTHPNAKSKSLDHLANGHRVHVCDLSKDQQWLGIVYTHNKEQTNCQVNQTITQKVPYHGSCRSGWVHKKWISVLAG